VGRAAALELLLLGDTWDAERAHAAGFAAPVTPAGGALAAAVALAQRLAGMAPVAAEYLKEAVLQGTERPMEAALQLEADLYFLLQTTDDRAEGIRAFHEKRTPQFEGR
jgi:enoyl-CoA hydratase/carnithine racemase